MSRSVFYKTLSIILANIICARNFAFLPGCTFGTTAQKTIKITNRIYEKNARKLTKRADQYNEDFGRKHTDNALFRFPFGVYAQKQFRGWIKSNSDNLPTMSRSVFYKTLSIILASIICARNFAFLPGCTFGTTAGKTIKITIEYTRKNARKLTKRADQYNEDFRRKHTDNALFRLRWNMFLCSDNQNHRKTLHIFPQQYFQDNYRRTTWKQRDRQHENSEIGNMKTAR